jgi:ribosome-binding factor A
MAFHQERLEKIYARELADVLRNEVKNPLLSFVTVTKVAITKDLSIATIYYTVMGDQDEIEATKKALDQAKGFLRSELAHRLDLRKTPELRFKYDESLAYGNHISEVIENLKK